MIHHRSTPAPIGIPAAFFAILCMVISLAACAQRADTASQPIAVDANKRYVGKSIQQCATIRFVCQPGERYFSDDNGCGCVADPDAVPPAEVDEAQPGGDGQPQDKAGAPPAADEPASHEQPSAPDGEPTICTPEDREAQMCIQVYEPVCGLFDPEKIQCVRAPCGQTFSNSCEACKDPNVVAWLAGECP